MKKNIFISYERQHGISEYFAGAEARGLAFPLFAGLDKSAKFRRLLIAISLRFQINFLYRLLLGRWKNELSGLESIVFTANREAMPAIAWLTTHYPEIRLHVFYLNPLKNEPVQLSDWADYPVKIWTFDKNDAEKYHLSLTVQPLSKEFFEAVSTDEILWDVVFVGDDKKRLPQLLDIQEKLEKKQLTTHFHITSTYLPNRTAGRSYAYEQPMSYQSVIQLYAQSRAVLEILQAGQQGSTMRAIEAGYIGKKLITTNADVVNASYYRANNIFLLTAENSAEIPEFLDLPYDDSFDYGIYEMANWLKQF